MRILSLSLPILLFACGGSSEPRPDHAAGFPGGDAQGSEDEEAHAEHGGHHGQGHGHHGHGGAHDHDFSDAESFAEIFDAPDRDEWQRPDEVVRLATVREGQVVVDLGAGTGYFEPYFSRAVGERGHVLALDVEPAMVEHMRRRFGDAGLTNVEVRQVAPDDPGLPEGGAHRIFIVNTWHHIADREAYAGRLYRALDANSTDGGAVVIVDFDRDSPHGPPPEMRLPAETVMDELRAGGLHPSLIEESLPYQYIVVAWRAPPARATR